MNTLPCFCCAVTTATLSSSTNDISQCCICKDYILRSWFTEEDYSVVGSERCHHRPVLTPDVCERLSFELEEGEKDLEQVTPLEGLADALVGKLCLSGCGSDLLYFQNHYVVAQASIILLVQYDFLSTNIKMALLAPGEAHTYILFVLKVESHLTRSVTV